MWVSVPASFLCSFFGGLFSITSTTQRVVFSSQGFPYLPIVKGVLPSSRIKTINFPSFKSLRGRTWLLRTSMFFPGKILFSPVVSWTDLPLPHCGPSSQYFLLNLKHFISCYLQNINFKLFHLWEYWRVIITLRKCPNKAICIWIKCCSNSFK